MQYKQNVWFTRKSDTCNTHMALSAATAGVVVAAVGPPPEGVNLLIFESLKLFMYAMLDYIPYTKLKSSHRLTT